MSGKVITEDDGKLSLLQSLKDEGRAVIAYSITNLPNALVLFILACVLWCIITKYVEPEKSATVPAAKLLLATAIATILYSTAEVISAKIKSKAV
jgi:hypothetical protein